MNAKPVPEPERLELCRLDDAYQKLRKEADAAWKAAYDKKKEVAARLGILKGFEYCTDNSVVVEVEKKF